MQKVTFKHVDRNATTIDDFYYRNIQDKLNGKKGTGVRVLAAEFIKLGKALDRFVIFLEFFQNQTANLSQTSIDSCLTRINYLVDTIQPEIPMQKTN
jgi:hypothetical protein